MSIEDNENKNKSDLPKYKAGSAISQAKDLIGIQLGSSVITFFFNTLIARAVGPEIFGIANIEFYVVYSAAQFLSREYVRKSSVIYSKKQISQRDIERQIFSLGWYAAIISVIISSFIYLLLGSKEFNKSQSINISSDIYLQCILLCTVSGLIEMFAEPFILIAHIRVWSRKISAIEAIGLFLKCIFAFIFIHFFNEKDNHNQYLISFGKAQIYASFIVILLWYAIFIRIIFEKRNKKDDNITGFMTFKDLQPCFIRIDYELIESSFMFFFQSAIKFGLTEGEKIVMIGLNINATVQGIYSLVSNLGSLIARYVFAQIEKAANTEFSKLDKKTNKNIIIEILSNVLKIVIILALLCVVFSPNYSFMALDIIYGEKWSKTNAPNALALYCWYLLFMSVNGITEAFVQSETPNKYYQMFLIITSIIYWIVVAYLMNIGVNGLIYANCINMLIRIGYNCWFINRNINITKIFYPII
eukprot:19664_1